MIYGKILKTAMSFQNSAHDVIVNYFSTTGNIEVAIFHGGFEAENIPEVLNTRDIKPETILFKLLALLNEKEAAA